MTTWTKNVSWFSVLVLLLTSVVGAAENKPTMEQAKDTTAKWLAGLKDKGLVLNNTIATGGFNVSHGPSAVGQVTKFVLQQDDFYVSFAFKGEFDEQTPLKTLQDNFWYVALDRVPTPGLAVSGWEIRPQTPTSSINSGVEVQSFGQGKIKLRVQTKFFAIYGRDPAVLVPADAPLPATAYFQIRQDFPLDLTIEAPFQFKK